MLTILRARIACILTGTPRFETLADGFCIPEREWPALVAEHCPVDLRPIRPFPSALHCPDERQYRRAFFAMPAARQRLYLDMLAIVAQGDVHRCHPLYEEYWARHRT